MIYVLTSNDLSNSGYYNENDNFQICILEEIHKIPKNEFDLKISTYYSLSDNIEEYRQDYEEDTEDDVYEFIQVPYLYNSIEALIAKVTNFHEKNMKGKTDDEYQDLMVIICVPGHLGRQITKDVNKILKTKRIEVEAMSLYDFFDVHTIKEMSKVIKNKLGTEFVYESDPIVFGYSVYRSLNIGRAD